MRKWFYVLFLPLSLLANLEQAAEEIVQAGIALNQERLCPATSGNLSRRIDDQLVAVTVSGKHKGELTLEDVIQVDLKGTPQGTLKKASAETLLHTMLYTLYPDVGAVLHTHSTNGVVLSRMIDGDALVTEGYEIHKVFGGIQTHESTLHTPIFENSQDIASLASLISKYLQEHPNTFGFLLRGHGFYTWGKDMKEARYRIEAFEQLFECEILTRALNKGARK